MMRNLFRVTAAAVIALGLAACGATTGTTTTGTTTTGTTTTGTTKTTTLPVTLAGAQAEASAILAAVQADAPSLIATLSAADQSKANTALTTLGTTVNAFLNVPANASPAQYAAAVTAAVDGVVAVLPLDPATKLAIDAGGALIDALVAGISAVTVTEPVTTAPTAAPTPAPSLVLGDFMGGARMMQAPVPIPLH